MKPAHYYSIFLAILLLGIASCKSKRQIIQAPSRMENKTNSVLFSDILSSEFSFSTFSSKLNLSMSTGKRSISSKARLKIMDGKNIQISIQPLFGVEVLRLQINPDSIVAIDRMNKRYVKESIADLKKNYPIGFDYNTLQSLFTGKLFASGKTIVTPADYNKFSYVQTANSYYLKSADQKSNIEYSFTVNGDDKITFSHLLNSQNKYALQWGYSDFTLINKFQFPMKMTIHASNSNKKIEIGMNFSDIAIDEPMDLHIKIPASYTKVHLSDIIKDIISYNS